MKQLLSYRLYRILKNRQFWGLSVILVLVAELLSHFRSSSIMLAPYFWGKQTRMCPIPTDGELQAFFRVSSGLSASGYLFLIPSVLCSFLVHKDYSENNLLTVVSNGFAALQIHLIEAIYLALLNMVFVILIRIVDFVFLWNDYNVVISWMGIRWVGMVNVAHLFFSLGILSFFFLISAYCTRYEIPLMLGFTFMAMDTLGPDFSEAFLSVFPTGGIQGFWMAMESKRVILYVVETVVLAIVAVTIPLITPSNINRN